MIGRQDDVIVVYDLLRNTVSYKNERYRVSSKILTQNTTENDIWEIS